MGASTLTFAQGQKTELFVQTGHADEVVDVDVSPDGKFLATASEDQTAIIWDIASGKQYFELQGHTSTVEAIKFTPDNKYVVTGGYDDLVKIWNLKTGKMVKEFKAYGTGVAEMAFSADGKYLVTSGNDIGTSTIKLWKTSDWSMVFKNDLGPVMRCNYITFSNDQKQIIASMPFNAIYYLNATTGKVERKVPVGKEQGLSNIHFSPDQKSFYAVEDKISKLDAATGKVIKSSNLGYEWYWTTIDGGKTVVYPDGKKLVFHDMETGVDKLKVPFPESVTESASMIVQHPHDPNRLISVHDKQHVVLWDARLKGPVRIFGGQSYQLWDLSYHPNKPILGIGSMFGKPLILDLSSAELITNYDNHTSMLWSLDFRPNSTQMVSCGQQEELHVYDFARYQDTKIIKAEEDYFKVAYSLEGDFMVGCREDGAIEIIDPDSGTKKNVLKKHEDWVLDIAFMPEGKFVTTSMDFQVLVWDAHKAKSLAVLKERHSGGGRVAYVAGKNLLALTHGYMIEIYDMKTYAKVRSLMSSQFISGFMDVATSPDGKWVAGACLGGDIVVYDTEKWEKRVIKKGHTSDVYAITFSNDSKTFVTGGIDGKVNIWNVETLGRQSSIICTSEEDFVITTPDNYYTATKGALGYVGFKVDGKIYPFEQFDLKFNRPDKVIEELSYANPFLQKMYNMAYKKRLKRMGFTEEMLGSDFNLPSVTIKGQEMLTTSTDQKMLELSISAKDELYKIDRINVAVNGVPVPVEKVASKSKGVDKKVTIELSEGRNLIQVWAMNEKGVESGKEMHEVAYKPAKPEGKKLHVLAFGVSKYKDSQWDLTYAAKDAKDLSDMYRKYNDDYFTEVSVTSLSDNEVSTDKVKALGEKLKNISVNDHVILYYSSHGLLDEKFDYYLATPGVDFNNPVNGGLPYEVFEDMMKETPARNKLLLIDACHSGEIDKESVRFEPVASNEDGGQVKGVQVNAQKKGGGRSGLQNSFAYMKALFADLSVGSGATIISAAGGLEFAYESPRWNNGVFTYSILQGVNDKLMDKNEDRLISVGELRSYVTKRVSQLTRGKQTPTTRNQNLMNDFIVH